MPFLLKQPVAVFNELWQLGLWGMANMRRMRGLRLKRAAGAKRVALVERASLPLGPVVEMGAQRGHGTGK